MDSQFMLVAIEHFLQIGDKREVTGAKSGAEREGAWGTLRVKLIMKRNSNSRLFISWQGTPPICNFETYVKTTAVHSYAESQHKSPDLCIIGVVVIDVIVELRSQHDAVEHETIDQTAPQECCTAERMGAMRHAQLNRAQQA